MRTAPELAEKLIIEKEKETLVSEIRKKKYASNANSLEALAKEPLEGVLMDPAKLRRLVDRINSSPKYQPWTKSDFRLLLKALWKIAHGTDLHETPAAIRYIKTGIARNEEKKAWELPNEKEIKAMLAVADPRDKAIISLMYELGCRVGEIMIMKKTDVQFDDDGCRVHIPAAKTDSRTLLAVNSVPYLSAWLTAHPLKERDALLFVSYYKGKWGPMQRESALKAIKGAARRAGIKKRIYCHLLRHAALTQLAKAGLNGAQLNVVAGWRQDSVQTATYLHLGGADLDGPLRKARGQNIPAKTALNPLAPIACAKCHALNPHDATTCQKCAFPLGLEKRLDMLVEVDAKLKRIESILEGKMDGSEEFKKIFQKNIEIERQDRAKRLSKYPKLVAELEAAEKEVASKAQKSETI